MYACLYCGVILSFFPVYVFLKKGFFLIFLTLLSLSSHFVYQGWHDYSNVFNHVKTPSVFGHGSCPNIVATDLWLNDSSLPNLQGATNNNLQDVNGTCTAPIFNRPPAGQVWAEWPAEAQEIVDNAGKRAGAAVPAAPAVPAQTPNVPAKPPAGGSCLRFGALPCVAGKASQRWILDAGSNPGDGKPTKVKSAVKTGDRNDTAYYSCWKTNFQYSKNINGCGLHNTGIDCAHGCEASVQCTKTADWNFLANGSITNGQINTVEPHGSPIEITLCLARATKQGAGPVGSELTVQACTGSPQQVWKVVATGAADGSVTVEQGGACVDNNFVVPPGGYAPHDGAVLPWAEAVRQTYI